VQPVLPYNLPDYTNSETDNFPDNVPFEKSSSLDLSWLGENEITKIFEEETASKSELDGLKLFRENFVSSFEFHLSGDHLYVKSSCKSAYTKHLSYQVKIKIDIGSKNVQSRSCTCVAGMGPKAVCKHVAATLYGLHYQNQKGTVTERLQQWHVPRKPDGKLEHLPTSKIFKPKPDQERLVIKLNSTEITQKFVKYAQNSGIRFAFIETED
jgi:hypothetical protein